VAVGAPAGGDAESGALLRQALDAAGAVAYARDYTAGRFEYVGPGVLPLLGFPPEEFTESLWNSLVLEVVPCGASPGLPVAEATRQLRDGLGRTWCAELRVRTAEGGERWLFNAVAKRLDGQGRLVGSVGVLIDVTQQKRLQEALRRDHALAVVGRVTAGAAHDLNNLLTAMTGYEELTLSELPAEHPAQGYVKEAVRAGEVAAAIVRRLLACVRPARRRAGAVDLNALVSDLTRLLQRLSGQAVELSVDLGPGLWPVRAAPGELEQVVLNLVANARDAMPAGGHLTVTTRNLAGAEAGGGHEPAVLLEIKDTGYGMTEGVRVRVFEPFFSTKGDQGSALGLAVVEEVVGDLGGRVEVESEPGRGATFRVFLPRTSS
jgi:PAS domain S-box-containing protein